MAGWQTVRVFISSTFRDMHAERDHLVKVVFPALREELEKHHVHLVDVDLRWGVTKEQADNDETLDVCLDEIDTCRPFFIGILGERYGYVSSNLPDRIASKYGWIRHHTGKSITELEIAYGVLQNPQMRRRAFFYFRDAASLLSVPESIRRTVYCETEPEPIAKLHDLKERIRRSGFPLLDGYPARWDPDAYDRQSQSRGRLVGLEAFGDRIRDQLWQAIHDELQLPEQPPVVAAADPLAEEQDYHERFMESRLRVYVGREQINDTLLAFADGDDSIPCLVTGSSGSGKSAALARFITDYAGKHQQEINDGKALVIPHFIGASPRSTNLRDMLRRFCHVFKARFGFTEDVPEEVAKLSVTFREFVGKIPSDARVLLVIDALNQLDDSDRAQELYWLPGELPAQLKAIVSCITDSGKTEPVMEAFHRRKHCPVQLASLTNVERRLIIRRVPSLSAKSLDDDQVRLLLSNPATTNPLFLLVALEELRGFGSFEQLTRRIEQLPSAGDTVTTLFLQVIERLENEFDPRVVHDLLSLLASARRGLSQRELLDLLEGSGIDIFQSTSDLFPVLRQLRPYLQYRGQLLDFFHRNLYTAVREKYLASEEAKTTAHGRLADYFALIPAAVVRADQPTFQARQLIELPYQQTCAGRGEGLSATLMNFDFIDAKCRHGFAFDLEEDYRRARAHFGSSRAEQDENCPATLPAWISESVLAVLETDTDPHPLEGCGPLLTKLARKRAGNAESNCAPAVQEVDVTDLDHDPLTAAKVLGGAEANRFSTLYAFEKFVASHLPTLQKTAANSAVLSRNTDTDHKVTEYAEQFLRQRGLPWMEHLRSVASSGTGCHRIKTIQTPFAFRNLAVSRDGHIAAALSPAALGAWELAGGEVLFVVKSGGTLLRISATGNRVVLANGRVLEVRDGNSGALIIEFDSDSDIRHLVVSADAAMAVIAVSPISETIPPKQPDWRASLPAEWNKPGNKELFDLFALIAPKEEAQTKTWYSEIAVIDLSSGCEKYRLDCSVATDGALWLSPCGRMLAAIDRNHDIIVWSVAEGMRLGNIEPALARDQLELSDDCKTVVWLSQEGKVRTWDLNAGAAMRTFEEGITIRSGNMKTYSYQSFALAQDARSIATLRDGKAYTSNRCELFDAPFEGDGIIITELASQVYFSSGRLITAGYTNALERSALYICGKDELAANEISVWESIPQSEEKIIRHTQEINILSVAMAADGRRAASVVDNFPMRVWDVGSPHPIVQVIGWLKTKAAALNPRGDVAVTARFEESIKHPQNNGPLLLVWSVPEQQLLAQVRPKVCTPHSVGISDDSRFAVGISGNVSGDSQELLLIDLARSSNITLPTHSKHRHLAISPDGRTIATAGEFGESLALFDIRTGEIGWMHTDDLSLRRLLFSADGKKLLGHDLYQNQIVVWSVRTRDRLLKTHLTCHEHPISGLALTADGNLLVTADSDGIVCLSDLNTGNLIATWRLETGVNCCSSFSAGNLMAVGLVNGEFGYLRLTNYNGERPYATLRRDWQEFLFRHVFQASGPPTENTGFVYCCPHCQARNFPAPKTIQRIRRFTEQSEIGIWPAPAVAAYPEGAWADSALITKCSACHAEIRLNPFFADALEDLGAEAVYRAYHESRPQI
jgi:WD40 repeat protein